MRHHGDGLAHLSEEDRKVEQVYEVMHGERPGVAKAMPREHGGAAS